MNWIEEVDDILATVENAVKGEEGDLITKARGIIEENRFKVGEYDTIFTCGTCGRKPSVIIRTTKGTFCEHHAEY